MFKKDVFRIISCIEYEDYSSAMQYAILIKDYYENEEKDFFEQIIKYVKSGSYEKIKELIKMH